MKDGKAGRDGAGRCFKGETRSGRGGADMKLNRWNCSPFGRVPGCGGGGGGKRSALCQVIV